MSKPMMKCGHAANATRGVDNTPCCVICAPKPEAYEIVSSPDLTGRQSKCSYKHDHTKKRGNYPHITPSSQDLPFFAHHPDKEFDEHYCGCMGWD